MTDEARMADDGCTNTRATMGVVKAVPIVDIIQRIERLGWDWSVGCHMLDEDGSEVVCTAAVTSPTTSVSKTSKRNGHTALFGAYSMMVGGAMRETRED